MNMIEISMYSIGSVFFFSALAFMYYAVKNSRLMRGRSDISSWRWAGSFP